MKNKTAFAYGFALLSSILAGLLTKATIPLIGENSFEFFQAAVVVSAWYGGLGPGVVTATASFVILDYFLIPPINAFHLEPTDLSRLIVFEAVAILTSSLSGKLRKARSELQVAHNELEVRIHERTQQLSQANASLTTEVAQRTEAEKAIMEISNREQRRLGQDLHDGLSQVLAGVKLMAEQVKRALTERSVPESKKMAMIESSLAEALAYVDTISRGLYPVELETNGLMAALEELSLKISRVHPVECRFKCWDTVALDGSAVANHVYRIAQEAVMNAIKGGKAGRINLRLLRSGDHVVISVADNGIGFGNGPVRKGMGIKLMENRARVINGSLSFRSRPTGGTVVRCSFPIQVETGAFGHGV